MAFPDSITGGCLSGLIRYSIDFSGSDKTLAQEPYICLCTQCRKASGAFLPNWITVTTAQFDWTKKSTLTKYNSTSNVYRGFCNRCGSTLTWRHTQRPDVTEIAPGSIDERWLIGDRGVAGNFISDKPGYGLLLGEPKGGVYWCENDMKGLTDRVGEKRVQQG